MIDEPLDGTLFGPGQPCYGCGPDHPHGFRLRYERDGDEVVTRFTPGEQHQGPLSVMHGGLVMTLADETAAWAILATLGKFGFTSSFEGKLRRPVRIHQEAEARAKLTRTSSRVVVSSVRILQGGELCFEASFTFVLLDASGAANLMQQPIREEWKRFCR